jgi:hypothetical protein
VPAGLIAPPRDWSLSIFRLSPRQFSSGTIIALNKAARFMASYYFLSTGVQESLAFASIGVCLGFFLGMMFVLF